MKITFDITTPEDIKAAYDLLGRLVEAEPKGEPEQSASAHERAAADAAKTPEQDYTAEAKKIAMGLMRSGKRDELAAWLEEHAGGTKVSAFDNATAKKFVEAHRG